MELPEYWESSIVLDPTGEPTLMLFLSNDHQMLSYHRAVVHGNYALAREQLIAWVQRSMAGHWLGLWSVIHPEGLVAYDDYITEKV